jgi:hypothetical protein
LCVIRQHWQQAKRHEGERQNSSFHRTIMPPIALRSQAQILAYLVNMGLIELDIVGKGALSN